MENITLADILIYLGIINLLTFIAYGYDKFCARRGYWRVPEKSLFMLIILGGTPTAFIASRIFKHKTKKGNFRGTFFLIVTAQVILILYLFKIGVI